jgi:DNA-binding NarL/FixJ family response regulator
MTGIEAHGAAPSGARRIVLADDHAVTRASLRRALEAGDFVVCGEAPDAAGAVAIAREHRPDVALLDINMPGNGIRAAAEIAAILPDTAIVMLTVSRDDADLFAALRVGASGYLLKDTDLDRLPHVLRAVLSGEAALPRSLVARVITELQSRTSARSLRLGDEGAVGLSNREWEILEHLRDGLTTSEIAERCFVAQVTVRSHVSAILKKLRVPDRAAAVRVLEGLEQEQHPRL